MTRRLNGGATVSAVVRARRLADSLADGQQPPRSPLRPSGGSRIRKAHRLARRVFLLEKWMRHVLSLCDVLLMRQQAWRQYAPCWPSSGRGACSRSRVILLPPKLRTDPSQTAYGANLPQRRAMAMHAGMTRHPGTQYLRRRIQTTIDK